MDANAAAQPIGFFPKFPPPPKYIRVKAYYKKDKTFSRVFLAQELTDTEAPSNNSVKDATGSTTGTLSGGNTGKAIWALSFSKDGKYLAAAGQDRRVRVWAVIASPDDRKEEGLGEGEEAQHGDEPPRLKAPVFRTKPIQVYEGHTGSVLDLSWSKVRVSHRRGIYCDLTRVIRITFYCLPQWIRLSACGMCQGRSVSAAFSTVILLLPSSSTPVTIGFFLQGLSTLNFVSGVFRTKAWRSSRRSRI
jgi:WD40 repeat protein